MLSATANTDVEEEKPKKKRIWSITKWFFFFVIAVVILAALGIADASGAVPLKDTFDLFNAGVSNVLGDILHGDNDLIGFVWAEYRLFCGILFAIVLYRYVMGEADVFEVTVFVLLKATVVALLIGYYDELIGLIWGFSDGVAFGIQEVVVDNKDPHFLGEYIYRTWKNSTWPSIGIFDEIEILLRVGFFYLLLMAVKVVVYIGSVWTLWGYALAKIIGVIFIPFLLLEQTKNIFDAWVRFLLGFVFFNILIRTVLCLYAIAVNVFVNGSLAGFDSSINVIRITAEAGDGLDMIAMMFAGLFILVSCGGFASILAGGFQGMDGAVNALKGVAAKTAKLIIGKAL